MARSLPIMVHCCCFPTFSTLCTPTTVANPACVVCHRKRINKWGSHTNTQPLLAFLSCSYFPTRNCLVMDGGGNPGPLGPRPGQKIRKQKQKANCSTMNEKLETTSIPSPRARQQCHPQASRCSVMKVDVEFSVKGYSVFSILNFIQNLKSNSKRVRRIFRISWHVYFVSICTKFWFMTIDTFMRTISVCAILQAC